MTEKKEDSATACKTRGDDGGNVVDGGNVDVGGDGGDGAVGGGWRMFAAFAVYVGIALLSHKRSS